MNKILILLKQGVSLSMISFLITFIIHFLIVGKDLQPHTTTWADMEELAGTSVSGYQIYFLDGEYFMGLSYALAIAFTIFALSRIKINRKEGVAGVFGGISFSAILAAFGCFLIGCCGSPMAIVYLSLFGSSFLGIMKPLVFGITLAGVTFGYWKLTRKGDQCETCDLPIGESKC